MRNQRIPNAIGRVFLFFEVMTTVKSETAINEIPAKKRKSAIEARTPQSLSALKERGRTKVVK